jgi:ankyrin repeat protein
VRSGATLEAKGKSYYTPETRFFKSRAPLQFGSIFLISVISGYTALIWSSYSGYLEITRFLVESGANLEAKND